MRLLPLLIIFLLSVCSLHAQQYFGIQTSVHRFFTHSDNDLLITENNDWSGGIGFQLYYQQPLSPRILARISIGYSRSDIEEAQTFQVIQGLTLAYDLVVDNGLNQFPADFSVMTQLSEWLNLGIGPSLAWSARSTTFYQDVGVNSLRLTDRLSGLGFGAHGFLEAMFAFNEDSPVYVSTQVRLRYMSALWYQEKGRELRNYEFNYLEGSFLLGIGWKL
ncbi:MAG: hypothetical protein ACRBF0_06265 [Calditrichia bacterium]